MQVESLLELETATGGEVKVSHLGDSFLAAGGAEAAGSWQAGSGMAPAEVQLGTLSN